MDPAGTLDPAGTEALRDAIRHLHGCDSKWIESVHVEEKTKISTYVRTLWFGDVQVFDLIGHPTAPRAYAWSHETDGGSGKRRFFVVLHAGPVIDAATAVRASIAAG